MNDVKLLGRITADPELRSTQSGTPVTSFSLAVDRMSKGNEEKTANFFTIVCWNKLAEFATSYLAKGRQVVISGRLQNRKWQDKHGQNRVSTEVVANNIYFADSGHSTQASGTAGGISDGFVDIDVSEGDIPF